MKYFLLVLLLLMQQTAHSAIADVFKDCTLPNQDNNSGSGSDDRKIVFSPNTKYKDVLYCTSLCTRGLSSDDLGTGQELNDDLILNCKNLCVDKRSSSDAWTYSVGKRISIRKSSTQTVHYTDQNGMEHTSTNKIDYSVYPYTQPLSLQFSSSANDTKATDYYFSYPLDGKMLKIQLNTGEDNTIYNCGHQIMVLTPTFPNLFEMSPKTVSGGNAVEFNINVDNSKSITEALMNNPKYAGVYNFDFDGYVTSFDYNPGDFDNLQATVNRLFCDIYKQQVISNNWNFDCSSAATSNGFNTNVCNACSPPTDRDRYRSRVRTGLMTQSECENQVGNDNKNDYCNVPRYNLISMDQIKAYNKITTNGRFFASSFANSATESAWDKSTMTYHPCFNDLTEPPKNKDLTAQLMIQDYYSRSITFNHVVCTWRNCGGFLGFFGKTCEYCDTTQYTTQRKATWDPVAQNYVVTRSFSPDFSQMYAANNGILVVINDNWESLGAYLNANDSYSLVPNLETPSSTDTTVDSDKKPKQVGCFKDWSIYNERSTDLGITVSDGDILNISWGGNIILGNGLTIPFIDQAIAKRIAVGDTSVFERFSLSNPANAVKNLKFLRIISTLDFEGLGSLVGEDGALPTRPNNLQQDEGNICNGRTIYDDLGVGTKTPWHGLDGKINRTAGTPVGQGNTTNTSSRGNTAACKDSNIQGDTYSFKGKLTGVGNTSPLKIKYYSPKTQEERILFANSILSGGYQIKIERGGCPVNPDLKIAFGNSNSTSALQWSDIDNSHLSSGYVIAPNTTADSNVIQINHKYPSDDTLLFLKANTPTNSPNIIDNLNISVPDGATHVRITELVDRTQTSGGILDTFDLTKDIGKTIFSTLIGDPDNINTNKDFDGTVVMISKAFCVSLAPVIQALLVLYIGLLGIQFMIGTIQMNQKELISRLIKISIVMMLFSPSNWNWFIQNYIRMCIIGSLKLALGFQNTIHDILDHTETINDDIFNLFSMWKLFWYVIQQTFTVKLVALIFSSLAGLAIAIIIVMGVIKSFLIILQGVFVYLSAILTQCVLLTISPMFFPLKLFKVTERMFDNWAKQVISFAIIPSTVAVAVTLYFLLLLIGLDATMNFSYCKACWISIFSFCLVATFYILDISFIPMNGASDFVLPMGIVSGALTFLIITHTGQSVIQMAIGMISRIIAFQPQTIGKNQMSGVMSSSFESVMKTAGELKQSFGGGKDKELKQSRGLSDISEKIKSFDKDDKGDKE